MQTTGIEQVTYLQFLEVDALPPASLRIKNLELVLRGVGKKRCTGTAWVDAAGGSTVGSLDENSPIAGNPVGLQTPGQIAATLQAQAAEIAALKAFRTSIDSDNDGRVDAAKQQSNEYDFPVPLLTWNIAHGLGKRATAILLDSTGVEFLSETTYSDANTIIIRHSAPTSGKAILQ